MKEANLRQWHRYLGTALAIFIILQAGTGLLISLGQTGTPHGHDHNYADTHQSSPEPSNASHGHGSTTWELLTETVSGGVMTIHHGGGSIGAIYRILLGTGILLQTILGVMIFLRIRSRAEK